MMHWQYTPYVLPLVLSAAVSAALALFAWRRRPAPGATLAALLVLATAEWSLGYALELSSADLSVKILWAKVQYVGMVMVPVTWLAIVLQYTGREKWLTRRNIAMLAIEPLVTLLVVWTNDLHGLIYSDIRLDISGPFSMLGLTFGAWFWVDVVYSYLLLVLSTLLLIQAFIRSSHLYRRQVGVLLIGTFAPWLAEVLSISGLSPFPVDLTSFAFALSGLAVAWGLFRYRLLDIVPVAREAAIEGMSDGVIVLDVQNRIVDLNPAAQRLIGRPASEAIGQPVAQVSSGWPDGSTELAEVLVERYRDVTEAHAEIVLGESEAQRTYDLGISPLYDRRNRLTGRLVVLHDITERKRAEETLRESEGRYRSLIDDVIDTSAAGIFILDKDFQVVWVNEALEQFFGLRRDKVIGRDKRELIRERIKHSFEEPETFAEKVLTTYEDSTYVENFECHVLPDGKREERWLEHWSRPIRSGLYVGGRVELYYDITERKRAEEEIRQRTAQLEALRQVGLELTAQLDLDALLRSIVSRAIDLLGGTSGGLYLYRTEQDVLEWAVTIGPDLVPTGTVLHRGEGLAGRVWETGEPLIVDDYQHWEGRPAFYEAYPWTAVVGVPVRWGKELLGVLNVNAYPTGTFSPADAELLSLFATQAAIAIRNARLYEQAQQEIAERRWTEEALKAAQEYTRNIIDSSLDTIIAVDMDRHIVQFNKAAQETFGYRPEEILGVHVGILYADPREGHTVHQTTIEKGQCVREILSRRKNGEVFPGFLSASVLRDARGELVGVMGVSRDITERKRAEEALRWRNRELALLNRAGQAFSSTLDLDQVLVTVLEEVRRLLNVTACSVWLIEPETNGLVCRQVIGPQGEIVRGWRLAPGEGLAGWVARSGESLIVPDVRADERHFKDVDEQTGLPLRSILSVPLQVRRGVIGVLQVVDTEVDRFSPADLTLLEPLAASAAIAIENARLYEQARQDAETKAVLLREVNHRVKNNLVAIVGLLYAERRRAGMEDQAVYQSTIQNLANQVQSLTRVHSLLSASQWTPLRLSELTSQVISSSLQMLPPGKRVSVDVTPSPIRVTPDQAHNLALVINELVTNTVKYALQERNTAQIAARLALDDDTVLFEFRDDGPGYPEKVLRLERHNVGFYLIQKLVRESLRGELSLHNDHGAVAIIRFKAKA